MALTKKDLIAAISDKTGLPKTDVQTVLVGIEAVLLDQLNESGELILPGIGKFSVAERAARTGRNPRTGEPVEIDAKRAIKFSAAKQLKDGVN